MMMIHSVVIGAALALQGVAGFGVFSSQKTTRKTSSLSMSSALIVQNKGGGHGELGE